MAIVATIGLLTGTSLAKEYYLSTVGDDDAKGNKVEPWRSIAKANDSVEPGDTVIFLPGQYEGSINPKRSGTRDRPIIYRSKKRRKVTIVAESGRRAIELVGKTYLRIEGFRIRGAQDGGWLGASRCDHLVIDGCYMERAFPAPTPLVIRNCDQIWLLNNVFRKDQVAGNMCRILECSFILIEGNSFMRAGHSLLQITACRNVVVRANCFSNNWGRNYEFWSSGKVLVEGNIVTHARNSAHSNTGRSKNLYYDSIYRYNRVFRNLDTPLNSGSHFPPGGGPTSYRREPFRLVNTRIYHNTIANNLGPGWEVYGMNISSNVFANNVFFMNDRCGGGIQLYVSDQISRDNQFLFNLFRGTEPHQCVIRYGTEAYWTVEEANERSGVYGGFWEEFDGNISADPSYVDIANNDFRLKASSACLDAGRPLCLAIGDGEGCELPVSDTRYFYDGFGIEGEEGDWIAVGRGDNLARVLKAEFRYCQPGILYLDREVKWVDGMAVSLPWFGKAPDIGYHEYRGSHPTRAIALAVPYNPRPGEPVSFTIDTMGKEVKAIQWDFGDASGTQSNELAPTYARGGWHVRRYRSRPV